MADTKYFADLAAVGTIVDARIFAVQSDPTGAFGWKATALEVAQYTGGATQVGLATTSTNLIGATNEVHGELDTHVGAANPHTGSAANGANSDITSLSGLTTPLSIAQGGTNVGTALTNGKVMYSSAGTIIESELAYTEPAANQFALARGTSTMTVEITCTFDQNLSTTSNVIFNQITMTNPITLFSTDNTLSGDLDTTLVSEKALKAYIAGHSSNNVWTYSAPNITPTNAGSNLNMSTGGVFVKSVSSVLDVVAATGITPITDMIVVVQSSTAGDTDITANPQIVAGTVGQELTLIGNDDTKTVTLDDGTGLALNNGQSFTIGQNDTITFVYYNSLWIEKSRSDN